MDKKTYSLLISKSFHDSLVRVLALCHVASSPRDITASHERLRELLEKVLSYSKISLYPNDVLVELAEVLEGIYEEQENLSDYYIHMQQYLEDKRARHLKTKNDCDKRVHLDALAESKSELAKLDNSFKAWLYAEGYYAQHDAMYEQLLYLIHGMLNYENSIKR